MSVKSKEMRVGQVYELPTVAHDNDSVFVVQTVDRLKCPVPKPKFLVGKPVPRYLQCVVTRFSTKNGRPQFELSMEPYIQKFYVEGGVYPFIVKVYDGESKCCEVEDAYGLSHRLPLSKGRLLAGVSVMCRVVSIRGAILNLELESDDMKIHDLEFLSFGKLVELAFGKAGMPSWLNAYKLSPRCHFLREQHRLRDPLWVFEAFDFIVEELPSWFEAGVGGIDYDAVDVKLKEAYTLARALLEGSNFLSRCAVEERKVLRGRLSDLTRKIGHFLRACRMLREGDYEQFAERMFANLRVSGYLYKPDEQFHTFNAILRIHPQFIHNWMGELFDALTSWNISNWKQEPFRSAFVRQTEVYIRQNRAVVDELVSFKSDRNNTIVNKIIVALAIQMLIVDEGVDEVNLDCNRAMFYRYASYFNHQSRGVLLNKAFYCVMGVRFNPEFNWSHLRQFEILMSLAAAPVPEGLLGEYKFSYSTMFNTVEVDMERIAIVNGTPRVECPMLPGVLELWHGLQVVAELGSDVRSPSRARLKELAQHQMLWEDLDRLLFVKERLARIDKKGNALLSAKDGQERQRERVGELAAIVRHQAFATEDYAVAFSYLAYACALAEIVRNDDLAGICREHIQLLMLLQSFAKNRSIDAAQVAVHAQSARRNPLVNALYTRLSIVANIGHPENNQVLWEMLSRMQEEEDVSLIRMVLTLNLLEGTGSIEKSIRNPLMEKIGGILNVNFHQHTVKYYGTESQYVEFKTSIVYPPANKMQPDVERQNYEIAAVMCGFLNAEGGTLYIGVSDQGYECGLHWDLEYYKAKSMDAYHRRIEALIEKYLGSTANDCIAISNDEKGKYDVAVIRIKPSLRVISMKTDGRVYVRHTTSTRAKSGQDLQIFKQDREIRYQQILASLK